MTPGEVTRRFEQALRAEDERARREHARSSERVPLVEDAFHPIVEAAEEIRERLYTEPSLKFAITPDSVCITLADRSLHFTYSSETESFVGEETGYSWYDRELYAERFRWETAEDCVEAMIRLCARYVHMARAVKAAHEGA